MVKNSSMRIGSMGRRKDHLRTISSSCLPDPKDSISLENPLKKLVLGFIVRHSVVDLDGIHHKDVADDRDDELRHPVGVTEREKTH